MKKPIPVPVHPPALESAPVVVTPVPEAAPVEVLHEEAGINVSDEFITVYDASSGQTKPMKRP
jgi:hypothetical protein